MTLRNTPITLPALKRGSWALADQVLLSGGNFFTMVLLARGMTEAEFGAFTLVYSALLLANGLQSAVITQPHNVIGISYSGADYVRYTSSTAFSQVAASVLLSVVAGVLGLLGVARGWPAAPLLLALVPALTAWQLQEFVRRVLYTENRPGAACLNDLVSYGSQVIVIGWLSWAALLTPVFALIAVATTSALAALFGVWQLRSVLEWQPSTRAWRENWRFGSWLAAGEVLRWFSSAQMYQALAALLIGTAATGVLKSAQVVFGPARILTLSLGAVLPTRFARVRRESGEAATDAELRRTLALAGSVLGAYCLGIALLAQPLVRWLYGSRYAGHADVLALYAASVYFSYLTQIIASALRALHRTADVFETWVVTGVVAAPLGWVFIQLAGIRGAVGSMVVTSVLATLLSWRAYRRHSRTAPAGSGSNALTQSEVPIEVR